MSKKKKNKPLNPKLSSCCGYEKVTIAGLVRCSKCMRETNHIHIDKFHMWDVHDKNYQKGVENSEDY